MKIAVTGGIGSGKTTVMDILKGLGAKTLLADDINRELLSSKEYIKTLEKYFPEAFIDGVFDKRRLSRIVFADSDKKSLLESISHPIIMSKIFGDSNTEFFEIPLLKNEYIGKFDYIWYVEADDATRKLRIKTRDGRPDDETDNIIAQQKVYNGIKKFASLIIHNNGDTESLADIVSKEYWKLKKK